MSTRNLRLPGPVAGLVTSLIVGAALMLGPVGLAGAATDPSPAVAPVLAATTPLSATKATVTVTPSVHAYGSGSAAKIVVRDLANHAARGSATFSLDNKVFGSVALDGNGAASAPISNGAKIGRHGVKVTYIPAANSHYRGTYGLKAFDVIPARASWTVVGPASPVYAGRMGINLTLHGVSVSPGTVTLSLGGRVIQRLNVPANGYVPLRPAVTWSAGRQTFVLTYSGNGYNRSDSRQLVVTTSKATSSMTLASPATLGFVTGAVAKVTVSGVGAKPAGSVTLLVDGQARSSAGLSSGGASLTIPALSGGKHAITTTYSGDANHKGSSRNTTITAASSPCPVTARACVDLTHSLTWLQSGGNITYGPVPMLPGRAGYRTNDGTFQVYYKDLHHYSSTFGGAPMPYSVFFDGGIAFHEGSLSVQSHGCIHLSLAAAQTYFNTLHNGDQVYVFGSAPY